MAAAAILKNRKISAAVGAFLTKFDIVMQFDTFDGSES